VKFNRWSEEVNLGIRQLADGKSATSVSLRPSFLDSSHLMDKRYTYDGPHPNVEGYLLWKRLVDPLIEQLVSPLS
jgi:lysophospholipase L1-like esterase